MILYAISTVFWQIGVLNLWGRAVTDIRSKGGQKGERGQHHISVMPMDYLVLYRQLSFVNASRHPETPNTGGAWGVIPQSLWGEFIALRILSQPVNTPL